jgi:sugar lactone lactonase YvrE
MRSGFYHLDTGSDEVRITEIAPAPYATSLAGFNDGRVDPAGRLWASLLQRLIQSPHGGVG